MNPVYGSVTAKKKGTEGTLAITVSKSEKRHLLVASGFKPTNDKEVASFIHNAFNGEFEHRELEMYLARELLIGLNGLFEITDLLNTDVQLMHVFGNKKTLITKEDIRAKVLPLFTIVSESDDGNIVTLRYKGEIFFNKSA